MRWIVIFVVFSSPFFSSARAESKDPVFLSADQIEKLWGNEEFKAEDFSAKMVANLLKRNLYVAEPVDKVKEDFGEPTGNYLKGVAPAYLVGVDHNAVLQLVFFTNPDGNKVSSVKVHKKFCSDTPPPPPEPQHVRIVTKDKKLGLEITGDIAKAMWDHMEEMNGAKGEKKGDSARCTKTGVKVEKYSCVFSFDQDGVIETR